MAHREKLETQTMTEAEFHRLVDNTQLRIEHAVENADDDLDIDNQGGVLTITFADRSKVIVSRQTPIRQLWLAARSGGFHFDYRDGQWLRDSDGVALKQVLSDVCSAQAGASLQIDC